MSDKKLGVNIKYRSHVITIVTFLALEVTFVFTQVFLHKISNNYFFQKNWDSLHGG